MQNIVVKMKDELEQIKEQVLNALKQETGTFFSPKAPSKAPSSGVFESLAPVPGDSIACPKSPLSNSK